MSTKQEILKRLFRIHGASCSYLFGETSGGVTEEALGGPEISYTGGVPVVSPEGGISGMGYISSTPSIYGVAEYAQHPLGNSARTIELAFRTIDPGVIYGFGQTNNGALTNKYDGLVVSTDSSGTRWYHLSNSSDPLPGLADGSWHHVFLRSDSSGNYKINIDDNPVITGAFPLGALDTYLGALRLFRQDLTSDPQPTAADLSFLSLWNRELSDSEVASHRAIVVADYKLSGLAVLEDSTPASKVLIRRVEDREHLATVIPQVPNGAWEVNVPPGDYEIACIGPDGYQPLIYSPVAAVLA